MSATDQPVRLMSWGQIRPLVGVSRNTIARLCEQNRFPRPRMIGRVRVWLASDIVAWQAALPEGGGHE